MDAEMRRSLRDALLARYPWTGDLEWGPAAVEAGECDGCGAEARLVQVCGPGSAEYLGRRCVHRVGTDAWCAGHVVDAAAAMQWVGDLPPEADVVARLWWVSTGEVRLDPDLLAVQVSSLALAW